MTTINEIVKYYLDEFPNEKERLKQLNSLADNSKSDGDLRNRKNFIGHVTASGIIVNRKTRRVLHLYHPILKRYLQPGGHLEKGDNSPLEAAKREVKEETGIIDLDYFPYHYNPEVPIDIDTHPIPENKSKAEKTHFHHDFRFVFLTNSAESLDEGAHHPPVQQWVDIKTLHASVTFISIAQKLELLLSRELRTKQFYDQITHKLNPVPQAETIVVTHILPDALEYLNALKNLSNVVTVIPKPKSIVPEVMRQVESKFHVSRFSRGQIENPNTIHKILANHSAPFVLFDIGGWFAPVVHELAKLFPGTFKGVVEDTENGHQKYERLQKITPLPVPVVSVARSPLKDNEDFLVGQSVLFSADSILRDSGRLIQYLNCAVLGFGKIGSSIVEHLLLRGVKPSLYDLDPIRRIQAYNRLGRIPSLPDLLSTADVIFSATGSHALNIIDFRSLKPGVFIFSVTSSDDEFDLSHLEAEYTASDVAPNVKRYSSVNNYFHLVNEGNAVNFIHKAVLGDFINLVRAEMLFAYKHLLAGKYSNGLHEVDTADRNIVAEEWINIMLG